MKLQDLVRKDKKAIKDVVRNNKRKNNPPPDEWADVKGDGTGDDVIRGLNNNEGYI